MKGNGGGRTCHPFLTAQASFADVVVEVVYEGVDQVAKAGRGAGGVYGVDIGGYV